MPAQVLVPTNHLWV